MLSLLMSMGLAVTNMSGMPTEVCAELEVDYSHFEEGNDFSRRFVNRKEMKLEDFDGQLLRTYAGSTMYWVELRIAKAEGKIRLESEVHEAAQLNQPVGFRVTLDESSSFNEIATHRGSIEMRYENDKAQRVTEHHIVSFRLSPEKDCRPVWE